MADVLSQSEVESLLAGLDPGADVCKHPHDLDEERMRALQALHDAFGREYGAALSSMLRTVVDVRRISVDQLTYGEIIHGIESPTCISLLRSEGLDGHLILEVQPSILFPILDRLLGGGREPCQSLPTRAPTEIERRLVTRITDQAIRGLEDAWKNLCRLELKVLQVESNPQFIRIVPPHELVVLIRFEIAIGAMRGRMHLCIPSAIMDPIARKLSSAPPATGPRQMLHLPSCTSQVEMVVRLAETTIRADELMSLAVGEVIMTGRPVTQGIEILVKGRPMFVAWPGQYRGRKAVRIGRPIPRAPDLVEDQLPSGTAPPSA